MIDGIVEVRAQPYQKESSTKKFPQEYQAMQQFVDAVKNKRNNNGTALSRSKVEEIFNINWIRKNARQENISDPHDGWYRERINSTASTVQIHIQPEGLAADQGDMMLNYTDMQGNMGDDAVQEQFQLDSTIPSSPCRKIMVNFLPGNNYEFRIWIPDQDGEHVIRGTSKEDTTGETTWSFE